ncbi:MAG TPA: flagellar basal body P-ring protein FlgI [Candidatus Krumholzibacteria bacterium]|nr:flagellar basal body P-ring protein FlgI [Candidatus Krumholzibacteria bacterium]HPD71658.1 flagellar basal body P-ring protein FlgI [Candidatus Krumholzibacteria bacterium]HRY41409.1 flagellar basal body P-ring protein FlgI [Candidatus Krumholzibacteria bacterium]
MKIGRLTPLLCIVACAWPGLAAGESASRIKDLAFLEGTTPEPLLGYGLVTGLNATGDGQSSDFTVNSLSSMLERLGVTVDPAMIRLKNVAAVVVTAEIDPTAGVGERVDVAVSSLGDATSLEGGTLIMTPLKAADGTVALVAQGAVSIGGFNIKSGANNSFRKNHATVGIVPGGGTIRQSLPGRFVSDGQVTWLLHNADFTTAAAVARAVNDAFGAGTALALDAHRVRVAIPPDRLAEPIPFIASLGELTAVSDAPARVVINERTGTIIVGQNVVLKEAAVAHGTLTVEIKTYYDVSQPAPFSRAGETAIVPDVNTDIQDREAHVLQVPESSTVADVVTVLNEIGASPRDIIAILQALKRAGALQAELIIM